MSLSMSGEAHLGTAKSRDASSLIVIVALVAVVVAVCAANSFFLRAGGAKVATTDVSFIVGP